MEYRSLGQTDLKVSVICLGTMTWGEQNTEAEAHQQMDYALEGGVNFWDTAEMYPVPPKGDTQGRTEACIGTWFQQRKKRDQVILATKVAGPSGRLTYLRDGNLKLDRKNMVQALEDSLKRLQTDYIDLYQLHWPDRETNCFGQLGYKHDPKDSPVPLEETLAVLAEFVQSGKVRHVGVSNETPWGLMRFLELSKSQGLPRMVSIQNPYSLLNRSFEVGLAEVAIREHCGLLAYSPLAFGLLSGKYQNGAKPKGARLTEYDVFDRYKAPHAQVPLTKYLNIAQKAGLSPAQMALAFVNQQPFVTSNIIGATTLEQLKENIESIHLNLSPEILAQIEEVQKEHSNPCP
jgi:aryl-alcohol dehydrogenase-like predicted oxidoreductase